MAKTTFSFSLLIILPILIEGAKVLFLATPQSPSHRKSLYPLAEALQSRGHDVTMIATGVLDDGIRSGKIHEKLIISKTDNQVLLEVFVYGNASIMKNVLWEKPHNHIFSWNPIWFLLDSISQCTIREDWPEIERIRREEWDLVFVDEIFNSWSYGVATKLKVPYVIASTTIIFSGHAFYRSIPHNPATISPAMFHGKVKSAHFTFRLQSFGHYLSEIAFYAFMPDRLVISTAQKIAPELLSFGQFLRDAEMSSSDFPELLEYARPSHPTLIEAGNHCKEGPSGPLPEEMERFVNDQKSKGTIYLGFGTIVRWGTASAETVRAFLVAMSHLRDYRFLWQYNGPKIHVPPNVLIHEWFPQRNVLAHLKTKVFFSHGGLKSK